MIKTFRGQIVSGEQDTILLHTNDGSIGYRIVKFQIMPGAPMKGSDSQAVVQIFKVSQTTIGTEVDFSNNVLIGAATLRDDTHRLYEQTVIFDSEIFNQDIYVTYKDDADPSAGVTNYYLELEQIKLDINSNTVATLKDMRNTAAPRP